MTTLKTLRSVELIPCNLDYISSIGLDATNLYVRTNLDEVVVVKRDSKQTFFEQPKFTEKNLPCLKLSQYYQSMPDDKLEYKLKFILIRIYNLQNHFRILFNDRLADHYYEDEIQLFKEYKTKIANNDRSMELITSDRICRLELVNDWCGGNQLVDFHQYLTCFFFFVIIFIIFFFRDWGRFSKSIR